MKNSKTFLVEIKDKNEQLRSSSLRLEELNSLATTLDCDIIDSTTINLAKINPATLIGKGKLIELSEKVKEKEIELVIFDTELSPTMQRNLEEKLEICVIDRREVIIEIFANRAATNEAKLQVKLAQNQYSMNRLNRRWINFSQQRGGVKGAKGEGEKQIELDRRVLQSDIIKIKKELEKIKQNRKTQQKNRINSDIINIALVGYTNSGKSSLLKSFTNEEVFIEDKLFATLDPLTRKVKLPSGKKVLISDTVGLINNLPHFLIEAFSSTLEEAKLADIILIVIDASHPDLIGCYKTTIQTLSTLGVINKPTITLLNKIDLVDDSILFRLAQFQDYCPDAIKISLKDNINLEELYKKLDETIETGNQKMHLVFCSKDYKKIAYLRKVATITSEKYQDEKILIEALVPFRYYSTFLDSQLVAHKRH